MNPYLVFRLYGPMASWGLPAVGGDRPTATYPGRSAILGLLGAALGIRRDDEASLSSLSESIFIGVKQCAPTSLLRDYHTTQMPSHKNKLIHRTRKSELAEAKLNTVLSSRDYRCDGLWVVAIMPSNTANIGLESIKDALLKPVYTLSLGRKSCPLALPLSPQIVEADNLQQALDTEFPPVSRSVSQDHYLLRHNGWATYCWEGDIQAFGDVSEEVVIESLRDEPTSRQRWQFAPSEHYRLSVKES